MDADRAQAARWVGQLRRDPTAPGECGCLVSEGWEYLPCDEHSPYAAEVMKGTPMRDGDEQYRANYAAWVALKAYEARRRDLAN